MRTSSKRIQAVALLSLISSSVGTYGLPPGCHDDNCYRAIDRFSDTAVGFCATYTMSLNAKHILIPTYLNNCNSEPSQVSSACSCKFAQQATTTSDTSSSTEINAIATSASSVDANPTLPMTKSTPSNLSTSAEYNSSKSYADSTTAAPPASSTKPKSLTTSAARPSLDCQPDNCLRELEDSRYRQVAREFCVTYTNAVNTEPSAIPDYLENCSANPSRVSSACSCIAFPSSSSNSLITTPHFSPSVSTTPFGSSVITTSATDSSPSSSSIPTSSFSSSTTSTKYYSSTVSTMPSDTYSSSSVPSLSTISNSTTSSMPPTFPDPTVINSIFSTSKTVLPSVASSSTTVTLLQSSQASEKISSPVTTSFGVTALSLPSILQPPLSTITPQTFFTSTVYTTIVSTVSQCPLEVASCSLGHIMTATIPLYTTICLVTETSKQAQPPVHPASLPKIYMKSLFLTANSALDGYTTSVIYVPRVSTVTKCPPKIKGCSLSHLKTYVSPIYNSVCSVTDTANCIPSAPGAIQSDQQTMTSFPSSYRMSFIYITRSYTVTQNPNSLTDCAIGSVTTETPVSAAVSVSSNGVCFSISVGNTPGSTPYSSRHTLSPSTVTASVAASVVVTWSTLRLILTIVCFSTI